MLPAAFRALLHDIAAGPEPTIDALEAGEVLAELGELTEHARPNFSI